MTRLNQAMEWFHNQEAKNKKVYVNRMPIRHRDVLRKHDKIKFNFGMSRLDDYYTLR